MGERHDEIHPRPIVPRRSDGVGRGRLRTDSADHRETSSGDSRFALCHSSRAGRIQLLERPARRRTGEVVGVDAVRARKTISPDHIVTRTAVDRVGSGAAEQHVASVGADPDLSAVVRDPDRVALRPADVADIAAGAREGPRARDHRGRDGIATGRRAERASTARAARTRCSLTRPVGRCTRSVEPREEGVPATPNAAWA